MLTKEQKNKFIEKFNRNKNDCAYVGCVDDNDKSFIFSNTACHASLSYGFGYKEELKNE